MSLPFKETPFFGLKGTKSDENIVLLPGEFSPGGSQYVMHDRRNRLRRIPGASKLNATQVKTLKSCRGLYSFVYESSGVFVLELLGVFHDSLYKITVPGGVATLIGTGISETELPSFAKISDKCYIASGSGTAMRVYDGSTISDVGSSQPTAPALSDGGATADVGFKGQYRGKYLYILADHSWGIASPASTPLLVEDRAITFGVTNGPVGTLGKVLFLTVGDNDQFY